MNQSNLFANVSSIETMGLVDGPGIRIVVFLQGCNLRCLYCHNPETWSCEDKNIMSIDEVVNKVLRYKSYISKNGGVTFSGGEPLLQSDFVYECCKKLKEENIHICIDTAGIGTGYEQLIDVVDLFIVDVKSIYEDEYKYIAGRNIEQYHKFMNLLQQKEKKIWIRQVIVPTINDDEKHIIDLANYVNDLKNVEKVELLAYHTMGKEKYDNLNIKYRLEGIEDLSSTKIEFLRNLLKKHLKQKI